MDVKEAIEQRRAVKRFDPDHRMSAEERRELLSLTLLSPTAFNIQHWRFVVVEDPELRQAIRAATWMQPQITDASLLVVLCADTQAWRKDPARYWRNAPAESREGILEAIEAYYEGREQTQRDEALRSCAIAAQTLMLSAKAMGYDSCPMDLSDFDEVGRLINLPEDHLIALFVAVGKALEPAHPRGGQLPYEEMVIRNRF